VRIKHCSHTVLMVLRRHWVFVSFLSRVVVEFLLHPVNLADIFFFLLLLVAGGRWPVLVAGGLLHSISIVVMYY
jgi:hypothetical protein